jgi:SnoaL-like domain
MNDPTKLAERYLNCWNTADATELAAVLADDCAYTDPLVDVRGREQVDGVIAAVRTQFPGLVFSLGGPVDAHHNLARFTWHLGPEGGEPIVIGFDVVTLDEDGRIATVHGFLDQVPSA